MLSKVFTYQDRFIFFIRFLLVKLCWKIFAKKLERKGLVNIESFKMKSWHDGFFYFRAEHYSFGDVFIKCQFGGNDILNELFFFKKLSKLNLELELCHVYDVISFLNAKCVIFEYLDNAVNLSKKDIKCIKIIEKAITKINTTGVFLRDVKEDNFLIRDSKLYLIDLTFSYQKEMEVGYYPLKNKYVQSVLGSNRRPGYMCWDDMYSLFMISKIFGCPNDIINSVKRNIGVFVLKIKD